MQVDEILIIKNAHEDYGISTKNINQISRVPSLMPLPLRPWGVRGLCSVSGSVVSMVDMNLLLEMDMVDIDNPQSRIISLNEKFSSNTLLVSDIYNTVEVEQKNIEYLDNQNDPIVAIYKYKDSLVQVLSLEKLFSKMKSVQIQAKEISSGKPKEIVTKEEDSSRFLIFSMAREKYALEIDYLQEIILSDIEVSDIAGSSKEVMGLITLREKILVVIDLRKYYGFKASINDANRILVVSHKGKKVALYIDAIVDIKNFLKKNIEYMNETQNEIKISGVIHDDDGLISFFDDHVLEEILNVNEAFIDSVDNSEKVQESEEYAMEVIIFKLAGREYAFNVETVDEIIDIVKPTDVVFSDEHVDGIINIRGQIVTIVSLFRKLSLETPILENFKIIICNINNTSIGFVVDSVSDILNIKEAEIREDKDGCFDNVLHLDNGERLVLSMDVNKIILGD